MSTKAITTIELCAGAGGQALGFEAAGFEHLALVENDRHACATLRANRPNWPVIEKSLADFDASSFENVDIVAGGVPCPPFSRAGAQLGHRDERNLFPEAIRIVEQTKPRAVMFENVRGLLDKNFDGYRRDLASELARRGLELRWKLLYASDFGVPQLRPRAVGIALSQDDWMYFRWPQGAGNAPTVGEVLLEEMSRNGWRGAKKWASKANRIAPTLVGGSKKHGGADLGPTRAKRAWADLGVDALVLGDAPPAKEFKGNPRLTVPMTARLQGFPPEWVFSGGKTSAYRQIGNAFPPPVAQSVGLALRAALAHEERCAELLVDGHLEFAGAFF